jgi:TPR repeat protein
MRTYYSLPALLLLLGLLGLASEASADQPTAQKAAPPVGDSLAADLGKDVVEAAHPSAKKVSLLEHKESSSNGRLVTSLKVTYHGKFTGVAYTANIRITIDPGKPPRVVDLVYKDDNKITANKKRLEGVRPDLEKRLKDASDAKPTARAPQADPAVDSDVAAIERELRAGKGSQEYVEKVAGRRIATWKRAAEGGSPGGQFLYGRALELGAGVTKDQKEALRWYRKAADAGFPLAQNVLGWCSAAGEGVPKDEKEAVRWYRKAADAGLPVAQHNLGLCFRNGGGVEKSGAEAVKWFRKAADQGYPDALYNLAEMYRYGEGAEKDPAQAAQHFRKAAEAGHAYSFFELAGCYVNGDGVAKDTGEAEKCYRRGAEAGDFDCQLELANWNLDGRSGKPEAGEALKFLKMAGAQATDAISKRKVEHAMVRAYKTSGIEQLDRGNKEEAARLLRDALKLAEKLDKEYPGRFYIEDALGGCYLDMARYHEEAREPDKAVTCYQKASDLGEMKATKRLAKLYEKGEGVPADPEKAKALRAKVDGFKMIRITVPCEVKATGRKIPLPIYIRDDFRGADPLESQELWYKDEEILFPANVKEALLRLLKIAKDNKVSYVDLCKYAFEKKEPAPPRKEEKP